MQNMTTKIKVKDARGSVIDEKEVATYAGLLARAHEEKLTECSTSLVQIPTKENGFVAIAFAKVMTERGTFTGIGDASPQNVGTKILPHIIRMAETRAKARALRDAVNIGMVCLEELGGGEGDLDALVEPEERDRNPSDRERDRSNVRELPRREQREPEVRDRRDEPRREPRDERPRERPAESRGDYISDPQKRLLYRILAERGIEGDDATAEIVKTARVRDVNDLTKREASALIDRLRDAA